jgi:phage repressor protein C with HTH and peptisase S24 domain
MEHVPLTAFKHMDNNPCVSNFRDRIRQKIAELEKTRDEKVSLRSISLAAGLSEWALSKILKKVDDSPTLETIAGLAIALETSPQWLAYGDDANAAPSAGAGSIPRGIPVDGRVGAGAIVEQPGDPQSWGAPETATLPNGENLRALLVVGDSQLPRHFPGDFVLYDPTPRLPEDLIDQYAIVDTFDGRRLLKIIRRGTGDFWMLQSLNGDPELAQLIAAYEYRGTISHQGQKIPHPIGKSSQNAKSRKDDTSKSRGGAH